MFRPSPKPNLTDTYMCHSIVIKSKLTDTKIERQKKKKNQNNPTAFKQCWSPR